MDDDDIGKGLSTSWSTQLLASRLYSDRSSAVFAGTSDGEKKGFRLKGNMRSSASTPALRVARKEEKFKDKTRNTPLPLSRQLPGSAFVNTSLQKTSALASMHASSEVTKQENTSPTDSQPQVPASFIDSLNLTHQQLHDLFNVPKTFYYLCAAEGADTKAYDLQLTTQEHVNLAHYYTISSSGITRHKHGETEFTSLQQWQREYTLFHQISNIQFFRRYRRWKVCQIDIKLLNAMIGFPCLEKRDSL